MLPPGSCHMEGGVYYSRNKAWLFSQQSQTLAAREADYIQPEMM